MQRIALLISGVLIAGAASVQAQDLGEVIRTPDKAGPVVNHNLEGTWLYELPRGGQPATQVDVTMRVGAIRKTLRVTGDRPYQPGMRGLTAGSVQPFTEMPLTYERRTAGPSRTPRGTRTGRSSTTATRWAPGSPRPPGSRPRTSSTRG